MRAALLVLVPIAAGCAPGSPESELLARVERLRSEGTLPRLDPHAVASPRSLEFRARLREIDAALQEVAPYEADDRLRLSDWEDPERVAQGLRGLDAFFDDVEALLAEPFVLEALEQGTPLGFEPSEPQACEDPHRGEPWNRPEPGRHDHWTTLMCLKAIQLARTPGGSPRAAELLARGFDLAMLIEDRSLYGYEVRLFGEAILVDALQILATQTSADPAPLRAALDSRLQRAQELEHVLEDVRQETAHWTDSVLGELAGAEGYGSLAEEPRKEELRVQLIECTDSALDDLEQILAAREPCRDFNPRVLGRQRFVSSLMSMRSWYSHRLSLSLARIGLAVAEHVHETGRWPESLSVVAERFEGGLPANPCPHRAFRLDRAEADLVLRIGGRRCPIEDEWRWSRGGAGTAPDQ